jgi:hypothetical protein
MEHPGLLKKTQLKESVILSLSKDQFILHVAGKQADLILRQAQDDKPIEKVEVP